MLPFTSNYHGGSMRKAYSAVVPITPSRINSMPANMVVPTAPPMPITAMPNFRFAITKRLVYNIADEYRIGGNGNDWAA